MWKELLRDLFESLTHRQEKKFLQEVREGKWVAWGAMAFRTEDVESGKVILIKENKSTLREES